MAKYKCQNPDCNHIWEAEEEPFECPACQGSDFIALGRRTKWLSWLGITAGTVFLLIILIKAIIGGSGTTITAKADYSRCTLMVKIEGKHSKEYDIILRKDGVVHGSVSKKETKTFSNLEGTYALDVRFIGKGKLPKINTYPKIYTFAKPTAAPEAPQIIALRPTPAKLTNSNQTYTVIVITDTAIVPLKETEFSKDGVNWQRAGSFKDLKAGTYTFMVRNTRDKSLQDATAVELAKFEPKPLPTKAELNAWLNGIAKRRQSDLDELVDRVGGSTKVKGVDNVSTVSELANEAYIQKRSFQVTDMAVVNNSIVSITVK